MTYDHTYSDLPQDGDTFVRWCGGLQGQVVLGLSVRQRLMALTSLTNVQELTVGRAAHATAASKAEASTSIKFCIS